MAQTVAVQKGTLACNWDNNTYPAQTIFTQSSGVATRVITNSLELSNGTANSFQIQFFIYNSSTGIYSLLTHWMGFGASNIASPPGQPDPSVYTISTTPSSASYMFYNTSSPVSTLYGTSPANIAYYPAQGTTQIFYFPGNFWLSNGDSLIVRGRWGGTGNCYYNFTTVTES